jgi:XXXCH domain-containing protein
MAGKLVNEVEGIRKMTLEKKYKKNFSADQLAGYLRQLAALIDGSTDRNADDLEGVRMGNIQSIKLKIKRYSAGYSVKLKVKSDKKEISDSKETPPVSDILGPADVAITFKQLKKRMKSSFKLINENLVADRFPDRAVVDGFLKDVDRMSRFPDQCGERYAEFNRVCDDLLHAFENEDLSALRGRCTDVKQLRNVCHRKKS